MSQRMYVNAQQLTFDLLSVNLTGCVLVLSGDRDRRNMSVEDLWF